MELTSTAYVMLGMLRIGSRSGYEIRRSAELSLRFFWAVSPGQIYGELRVLEEAGLVRGSDEPKGSMKRRIYELTDAGEQALAEWVARPGVGAFQWRDLGLLKLFFSDVVGPEERRELLAELRRRTDDVERTFQEQILPAAARTRERHGAEMPAVVAEFGREFWRFMADWTARVEEELTTAEGGRPARP